MAWNIILKSFVVIVMIMIIAQGLYWMLGGKSEPADGLSDGDDQ